MAIRSGFVSIIGRPNAGKSTLLNALLGQKLAIVTHKPQTTRTRIQGVLEVPARKKEKGIPGHLAAQVVLVDTPGVHRPETQLDRRMMQEVFDALESRDAVLFIVDATHRLPGSRTPSTTEDASAAEPSGKPFTASKRSKSEAEDNFALSLVQKLDCPVLLVLNKTDAVPKSDLLPIIAHWSALHDFAEVVPISARKEDNLDLLLDRVIAHLPEGQRYFPKDQVTDQPERFLVAELIREKILMLTGEEVPYSSAVVVEKWEDPPETGRKRPANAKLPVTKISAAIICERTGQKAILIGKGGEMLKRIGTAARKDMESLLGTRVFLQLFVKVEEEWRSSRGFVEELDWRRQLEHLSTLQQRTAEPALSPADIRPAPDVDSSPAPDVDATPTPDAGNDPSPS